MHFSSSSTKPTSTNSFVFSFFQMADFRSGSSNSRPQPRWKWVFASEAFQFSNFAPRSSHDRRLHSISGPQLLELNLDPSSLEKCQNKIERRKKENFCRGSKNWRTSRLRKNVKEFDTMWNVIYASAIFSLLLSSPERGRCESEGRERVSRQNSNSNCEFPANWKGTWYHAGFPHPLNITGREISSKGFCQQRNGSLYLVRER